MSEYLGSRISLISNSNIRYVGTLSSINSNDSTVALQNVRSFGTEDRPAETPIEPSDQVYEFIVFRGSDVKDLRIEEGPAAKEPQPPAVPNDPAIVGARARGAPPGPPGPQGPRGMQGPADGFAQQQGGLPNQQGPYDYFPPPTAHPGWGNMPPPPYNMPPGPPGHPGPPPHPGHPGHPGWGMAPMWGPYGNYPPGGPIGGPSGPGGPGAPGLAGRQSANHTPNNQGQQQRPAPIGPAADKKPATPAGHVELPSESKGPIQPPKQQAMTPSAPPPPVESKPTAEEVKATAASLSADAAPATAAAPAARAPIPTGPKSNRPTQILPAVPLPAALTARAQQPSASSSKPAEAANTAAITQAALQQATRTAKAAVATAMANAMAKIETPATLAPQPPAPQNDAGMDNLTRKVNEMRVNAARGTHSNRGNRGRGPRPVAKVEVPDADFDFASANAKFNKEEIVKEAAAGSPLVEAPNGDKAALESEPDASAPVEQAYNKKKSFFDNIGSESKDRENSGHKPGGREWRGEEQRKNMETFGQGSVDGGYRGYRGGRGRGRGGRGRGYRGGPRGGGNNFRRQDGQQMAPQ